MKDAWAWLVAHPQISVPVGLAVLNILWRSKTRTGAALRTLGPDPVAFWVAMTRPTLPPAPTHVVIEAKPPSPEEIIAEVVVISANKVENDKKNGAQ